MSGYRSAAEVGPHFEVSAPAGLTVPAPVMTPSAGIVRLALFAWVPSGATCTVCAEVLERPVYAAGMLNRKSRDCGKTTIAIRQIARCVVWFPLFGSCVRI